MATFSQGKYFVISRPVHADGSGEWVPYAYATWQDKRRTHYEVFTDLGRTFATKDAAAAFGISVARNWINGNMWSVPVRHFLSQLPSNPW